jgi:hypothetical protein
MKIIQTIRSLIAALTIRLTPKTVVVTQLHPAQYKKLEAELAPPFVDNQTSEAAIAYRLGVQATLKKLREGFVV